MVMVGEDIPRRLSNVTKFDCYPGVDESDDEDDDMDVLGQSFDIQSGKNFRTAMYADSAAYAPYTIVALCEIDHIFFVPHFRYRFWYTSPAFYYSTAS
jgi:hypothetical protein